MAVTSGNLLVGWVKWEDSDGPSSPTISNSGTAITWTTRTKRQFSGTDLPAGTLFFGIVNATESITITATFSPQTAWKRLLVEQFSGINTSTPADGSEVTNQGTGSPFDTADIVTTTTGLVFLGVGAFGTLSSHAGAGSPTFSLGVNVSDTACAYLISNSAQTVSPSMTATGGGSADVEIAQAFKDAPAGGGTTLMGQIWM
jgi:hypothetical protein